MSGNLRKRKNVPIEDRWCIESFYPSDKAWEKDFKTTESFAADVAEWSGHLEDSPEKLLEIIGDIESKKRMMRKLITYAHLRLDEDLSNAFYDGMFSRINSRSTRFSAAVSFFRPELLRIPGEKLDSWLKSDTLLPYRSWLIEIIRFRPYTLSEPEEKILTMSHEIAQAVSSTFGKLNNVDIPARLPEITAEDGSSVKITNSNISLLQRNKCRRVRKDAFDGFYKELLGNRNTMASLLAGQVRTHMFYARARNFSSSLEASLFNDRVGVSVYDSLIQSVHDNLPAMHRYYALKKSILGLDTMHMYDIYVPIVEESRSMFSFDEAVEMTLAAVAPLGSKYVDTLEKGFNDRWVDRYENIGKRSGAYSSGCYDSHPYILHNFNGSLNSVFTLAHEAGHSMHSHLSINSQPFHLARYKILLAEVASTTNEMLLWDHLMKNLFSNSDKAYLLDHLINDFRTTIFRQTMFAEFERLIHEYEENDESITPDFLDNTYMDLIKLYHGDSFAFDEEDRAIAYEWSRIPHFYYNFYVYKYATGMASAVDISEQVIGKTDGAVDNYLNFLRGGSSQPPLDLLRMAGVNLETPHAVDSALAYLDKLVTELEQIMKD